MQYRAGLIEGSLEIRRRAEGGTSVVCVVRRGLHSEHKIIK
jgi:nitrate/nitrite-specific signal transduction histidine kinase